MKASPKEIGGANVVYYTSIDHRHKPTGNCTHIVGGKPCGPAAALAICQYPGTDSFYLLGCDSDWNSITETWHETIEGALDQAEFEYEGVTATWQKGT